MRLRGLYSTSALVLFLLFFGGPWLVSGLLAGSPAGDVVVWVVATLSVALELAWLYQLNVDLGRRCGYQSSRKEQRFSVMLLALLLIPLLATGLGREEGVTLPLTLIVFSFTLLCLVGAHIAQKLLACEAAELEVRRSKGWTTLAFIFLAIGIWFLQPRIRRLLGEDTRP